MKPTRFALVADTHIACRTEGNAALYPQRLARVVAAINQERVDFVLHAGDLTDNGTEEDVALAQKLLQPLQAPLMLVGGNHDFGGKLVAGRNDNVTAERIALFEKALGPSFFAERFGGVRILGINASLLGSGLPHEERQWTFLAHELGRSPNPPTILLSHYPPFVDSADEPADDYWNMDPAPRARLLALLRAAEVRAVFSGHLHRPVLHHLGGIALVSAPSVSFGLPIGQPQGWTLATITSDGLVDVAHRYIAD